MGESPRPREEKAFFGKVVGHTRFRVPLLSEPRSFLLQSHIGFSSGPTVLSSGADGPRFRLLRGISSSVGGRRRGQGRVDDLPSFQDERVNRDSSDESGRSLNEI